MLTEWKRFAKTLSVADLDIVLHSLEVIKDEKACYEFDRELEELGKLRAIGERYRVWRSRRKPGHPASAERLLLIMCRADVGEMLAGDLAERYIRLASRHGEQFANQWYWAQVAHSIVPLIWASAWRLVASKALWKRLVG